MNIELCPAAGVAAAEAVATGPDAFQGRCSCDWSGPERGTRHEANVDVVAHLFGPEKDEE